MDLSSLFVATQEVGPAVGFKPGHVPVLLLTDFPAQHGATTPLVGSHFNALRALYGRVTEFHHASFLPYYPSNVNATGEEMDSCKEQRIADIQEYCAKHNIKVVVTLGAKVHAIINPTLGSLEATVAGPTRKSLLGPEYVTIACYHPTDIFRRYHLGVVVSVTLQKAEDISRYDWQPVEPEVVILDNLNDALRVVLDLAKRPEQLLSTDIETFYKTGRRLSCISMAETTDKGYVIPFISYGKRVFTVDEGSLFMTVLRGNMDGPIVGRA